MARNAFGGEMIAQADDPSVPIDESLIYHLSD
jgi:hypothetical protein